MSRQILFSRRDLFDVIRNSEEVITSEIEKYNEHTVNEPIDDLCEKIYKKFVLTTPVLHIDRITQIDKGETFIERSGYKKKITYIKIEIPFSGDSELFECRPSHFTLVSIEAETYRDKLHILYAIDNRSGEDVRKEIDRDIANINEFLKNIESDLAKYNSEIKVLARKKIELRKEKLNKDRQVIEGLGFPIKKV